jgi:hypothetical protein
MEAVVRDFAKPLLQGSVAENQINDSVTALMKVLRQSDFDQSVLTAVPASFAKLPTVRGAFDEMVISQFEDETSKRFGAHAAALKAADAKAKEAQHRMEEVQSGMEEAQKKLGVSAEAYRKGQSETDAAQEKVSNSMQAINKAGVLHKQNHSNLTKLENKLDTLLNKPLKCFEELRERNAETRWVYKPSNGGAIGIRVSPQIAAGKAVGQLMRPGEEFLVSAEEQGSDGVLYLQLADGRGWVFDHAPGKGQMCQRCEEEQEEAGETVADAEADDDDEEEE